MNEGNRYRAARMARGLSQEDLSEACGVDARTIRKLEQGLAVSTRTVRRVTAALGIDPVMDTDEIVSSDGLVASEHPSSFQGDATPRIDTRARIPDPPRPAEGSGWMSKATMVLQVGVFVVLVGLAIAFLVTRSQMLDAVIVSLRSEVSAEIAYPAGAVRPENVVDDLKARQAEIGYRIVKARRGTIVGRDGSSDTLEIVLEPLDCPTKTPCDDVRKAAVFSDFSRRMLSEGGVTTVSRR